jgi:hypothetical protein
MSGGKVVAGERAVSGGNKVVYLEGGIGGKSFSAGRSE